jgi:stage II sporulation protein M
LKIADTYRNLYVDIRKKKYFLIFTAFIFVTAAVLTLLNSPELRRVLLEVIDSIRGLSQSYHNKALLYIVASILVHNAIALLITLFSGALFGLIPISMVAANGYLVGFVVIPRLSSIALLIPHGIFELPAIILACSYGIWLGLWPFSRGRIETLKHRLKQCIAIYFRVVVPLLVIAAIIEGGLFKYMLRHLR